MRKQWTKFGPLVLALILTLTSSQLSVVFAQTSTPPTPVSDSQGLPSLWVAFWGWLTGADSGEPETLDSALETEAQSSGDGCPRVICGGPTSGGDPGH